ncbi:MAG: DUF1071 domain-containing protein [Sideroxydans sp.]|nr:DUF1071 domain-containing protein [Sideroxydans sp.]
MESVFKKLYETNVNEHIEKKGNFSYLSWPYAIAQLRLADPTATWEVKRFADDLPYQKTDLGVFVEVSVAVQGVTLSQIHPVLDSKNKPLMEPSAFDINTSIQRCLVKAVALHGLGLYIYAGEDLPQADSNVEVSKPLVAVKPARPTHQGDVALLTDKQLGYINKLVSDTKSDVPQLLAFFNFNSLESIPKSEVNRVIRVLEQNRQKEAA